MNEKAWKRVCEEVDRNVWGEEYKIVTKRTGNAPKLEFKEVTFHEVRECFVNLNNSSTKDVYELNASLNSNLVLGKIPPQHKQLWNSQPVLGTDTFKII